MSLHRALVITLIGLVCLGGALIILSIWGVMIDGDMLLKILATLFVLIVLIGFLLVVKTDFGEHKKLKDNDFID